MGKTKYLSSNHAAESIRSDYFQWLCSLVMIDEPDHSYWILAKIMHRTEFFWTVPNDDNRAEDGKRLRAIYAEETGLSDVCYLEGPCSILEMLIGLAIRIEDTLSDPEIGNRTVNWFWEMIENLGIDKYDDEHYADLRGDIHIEKTLTIMLERTYQRSGKGGLFPLKRAKKDQRKVEIWYQMMIYLEENYSLDGQNL